MKILLVAGSLEARDGGSVPVVLGVARALAKNNIHVTLFAPAPEHAKEVTDCPGVEIVLFKKALFSKFLAGHSLWSGYSRPLAKALRAQAKEFDVIHTYSLWHYSHAAAYEAVMAAGTPFMVTVQGELTPWALEKQSTRSVTVQKQILGHASAIQAVCEQEAKRIKKFTNNQNIFIVPNGINPKEFTEAADREWLFASYPQLKDKKIILFLGRINEGKGLDVLARAFPEIVKKEPNARLLIAGPDDWGYGSKIRDMLKKENVLDKAVFTGMLRGAKKLAALKCAECFVLLSESEAFSISILEALYSGLPVVISPECNFPEVERAGAGKIIPRDPRQLSAALTELLISPQTRLQMGVRAKALMSSGEYFYDSIAKKIIGMYEGVIRAGHKSMT